MTDEREDRLARLTAEYDAWLAANDLPDLGSADEHLHDESLRLRTCV